MSRIIRVPYKFTPRVYQHDLLRALDSGYKRAIAVYHRRAGKDKTLFNLLIKKSVERVGSYYYFFPEFAQGRRVIWDGTDNSGFKFMDHIPADLVESTSNTDMKVKLKNGSLIQIIGTDKFDKVRGSNPVGCVFSEFAFQNPAAWDVVRPILMANDGWAVFNSTPFGRNHFYDLVEMAKNNPDWYLQVITVEDSLDENGERYVPEAIVQAERDAGMSEEMIQQEFYCSFTANSEGYFYLKLMLEAEEEGRICDVPHDPSLPVDTWWDLGIGLKDQTAIWFTQTIGRAIHVIKYFEGTNQGAEYYARYLQDQPYAYRTHNFPWDIEHNEWGSGRSRIEVVTELLGSDKINNLPKLPIADGVNAVRMLLPRVYFDRDGTEYGRKCLSNYHKKWNAKFGEYEQNAVHDWSSHASDAFRQMAVGFSLPRLKNKKDSLIRKYRRFSVNNWQTA